MRKTLREKYVVVSTKMRSKSVYSEGAHWEEQGLNPGLNFSLCLKQKASLSFFFFFLCFSLCWPLVEHADWYQSACSTGDQTGPKKKKEKKRKGKLVMAEGQYILVRSTLGKTKFVMFESCHDEMTKSKPCDFHRAP
jgi:hypothetical protein